MQYVIDAAHNGRTLKSYLQDTLALSHRLITRLKQTPNGMMLDGQHVTVRARLHEGQVLTLALEDTQDTPSGLIVPSHTLPEVLYETLEELIYEAALNDYLKMSYQQRVEFAEKNPEAFKNLK